MNRVDLLKKRKAELSACKDEIMKMISSLTDEKSFVETGVYSFSQQVITGEKLYGEGVITGYATVEDNPIYVIAQNFAVMDGGLTKAQCDKVLKCMEQAENSAVPVLYILNTHGVSAGEGIPVLEGMAAIIRKASQLKGALPQFAFVCGDCFGSVSVLAALCDFCFMTDSAVLSSSSPFVISAKSGVNLPPDKIAGASVHRSETGLCSFYVNNLSEISNRIADILDLLPAYGRNVAELDLAAANKTISFTDGGIDCKSLLDGVMDSYFEVSADYMPEVKCVLGRIGGFSCAVVAFDGEDGVVLNSKNLKKIANFYKFAASYDLPVVNMVNTLGFALNIKEEKSELISAAAELTYNLSFVDNAKISLIFGKAIGAGYMLFAAKSAGYDYTVALSGSSVALFDEKVGSEIEFAGKIKDEKDREKFRALYAEKNSDPFNAAEGGFVDDIAEPEFAKQYLISALQMSVR